LFVRCSTRAPLWSLRLFAESLTGEQKLESQDKRTPAALDSGELIFVDLLSISWDCNASSPICDVPVLMSPKQPRAGPTNSADKPAWLGCVLFDVFYSQSCCNSWVFGLQSYSACVDYCLIHVHCSTRSIIATHPERVSHPHALLTYTHVSLDSLWRDRGARAGRWCLHAQSQRHRLFPRTLLAQVPFETGKSIVCWFFVELNALCIRTP